MLSARTSALVLSSLVGYASCLLLPSTPVETMGFFLTGGILTQSDSLVYGDGTPTKPYALGAYTDRMTAAVEPPTEILLTDDPDRIFQSSPPSPLDLALMLHHLRRLDQSSLAIGTPLHWPEPDGMSLQALDRQLALFPRLITSSALSRTAAPEPIPQAFRRASIPLSSIRGNTAPIPVVNRLSLADTVLGAGDSRAGFSILDSEPPSEHPYLLAKWNDRVVLSFALLTALDHLGISHDAIEIHMGRYIDLKKNHLYIPIDAFGRIAHLPEFPSNAARHPYPAENLIDAPDTEFSNIAFQPVLIRNAQSNQELPFLTYSNTLSGIISVLSNPKESFAITTLGRPSATSEWCFIAAILIWICSVQSHLPGRRSLVWLLVTGVGLIIVHLLVVHFTATWLPTLPALASLTTASFFCRNPSNKIRKGIFRRIGRRKKPSGRPTTADLLDAMKNNRL